MAIADLGIIQGVSIFTMPGQVEANLVFKAQNRSGSPIPDGNALTDMSAYMQNVISQVAIDIHTNVTLDLFTVAEILTTLSPPQLRPLGSVLPTLNFTNVNAMLIHGGAALISADLDGIGKGAAKKFFPGYVEVGEVDSVWIATVMTRMVAAAGVWISTFGPTNQWTPITWTEARGVRNFQTATARDIVAYQRRRKPGVGI